MITRRSKLLLFWVTVTVVGGGIGALGILRGADDAIVMTIVGGLLAAVAIFLSVSSDVFEPRLRSVAWISLLGVSLQAASVFAADGRVQLVFSTCALAAIIVAARRMRWLLRS